jgi:toxin FitB
MYLLDTNVVSDARKGIVPVKNWLQNIDPNDLFLSVISIGEIARGIEIRARKDRAAAKSLLLWLDSLRHDLYDRILPITEPVALEWGKLAAIRTRDDADGMIAASAIVHGLTLVTRNIKDFDDLGMRLINPWTSA